MRHVRLGASLYVPATRPDLIEIGSGHKFPLRSVILCTEDSVLERDLEFALDNLAYALPRLEPTPMLRFVRVRSPEVLRVLLAQEGIGNIDGFVLPKVTAHNLYAYAALLGPEHAHALMPTLETREVFDPQHLRELRELLLEDGLRERILSLRIGGNDLLNLLGLRRVRGRTVYETPLAPVITQLLTAFKPYGFNLSAPVYDFTQDPQTLARETALDLEHGLLGKTAIHPDQVGVIEAAYRVDPGDLEMARRILEDGAAAVFRVGDAMCEPATHRRWAETILARAEVYGILEGQPVC
ncbi:citrate lyase beta subunit [Deinobacterium chartae]|uniref:Citrate lyase beta subunit n=1 Tax=Deinobacterium chartae TaxID=521158 RepID=A0A841I0X9_9DEIO|nr:HpcH/HpaI aldolase/citrate lyase family protein [Deinobacterium chartae]MBB6098634.1 citrate lyase beta subunit [Deinobacterium chartae]